MRILTGYLPATEGEAFICGHNVFTESMAVRRLVGYLPETPPLYPELTVGKYLSFVAEIREVPRSNRAFRVGEVMEQVGLNGWEHRIIGSLSKGYKQRVGLAQAIVHHPKVLILDEPTSGLDPAQVVGIRRFIENMAESRTVILSTHILSEVEKLCSKAIVINDGQIAVQGSLDSLREHAGGIRYRVGIRSKESGVPAIIGAQDNIIRVQILEESEGYCRIDAFSDTDPRDSIFGLAADKNWRLIELEKVSPSLEEAFLAVVGSEQ